MTLKQKNSIFAVVILAVVLFYVFSGGSVGVTLDFGEDALTVSASNYDWTVPYDQIAALELTELPDRGTCLQGTEKRRLCCGTWDNGIWGEYTLCVDPRIEPCIVVTLDNGSIYVLNYENPDSTEQLHQMFTALLHSKGYLGN